MGSALSSVGSAVATTMAEKQQEAMKAQREAQQKMMGDQMKRQISMQVAMTRERLLWQGVFYCTVDDNVIVLSAHLTRPAAVFLTGFIAAKLKGVPVPHAAASPIILIPYFMLYQADMAYGNKLDRVKAEADRILVCPSCALSLS